MDSQEVLCKLGRVIFKNDICEIAKLNMIIRENNYKLERMEILNSIYCAKCTVNLRPDECCQFDRFDTCNKRVHEYIQKYWNIFEYISCYILFLV